MQRNLGLAPVAFTAVIVLGLMLSVTPGLTDIVLWSGNNLGPYSGDLLQDYLYGVLWSLSLGLTIFFWPVPAEHRQPLIWMWTAKVFVILFVMLGYEAVYGLDSDGHWGVGRAGYVYEGFIIGHGSKNIRNLTYFHDMVMPNSYHTCKVSFGMLSMIGVYLFYRASVMFMRKENLKFLYLIGLFPSVVFWSSIVTKEPVALFGNGIYCLGVIGWYTRRRVKYLAFILLGVVVCVYMRFWYGPIMAIPCVALALTSRQNIIFGAVLLAISIGLGIRSLGIVKREFQISTQEELQTFQKNKSEILSSGGSAFKPFEMSLSPLVVAGAVPYALVTALYRPFPGEVLNVFGILMSLENVLLVILTFRAYKRSRLRELLDPVMLWLVLVVFLWSMVYGLVTTNFGTLVRYKLWVMPCLLALLGYLNRDRELAPVPRH